MHFKKHFRNCSLLKVAGRAIVHERRCSNLKNINSAIVILLSAKITISQTAKKNSISLEFRFVQRRISRISFISVTPVRHYILFNLTFHCVSALSAVEIIKKKRLDECMLFYGGRMALYTWDGDSYARRAFYLFPPFFLVFFFPSISRDDKSQPRASFAPRRCARD